MSGSSTARRRRARVLIASAGLTLALAGPARAADPSTGATGIFGPASVVGVDVGDQLTAEGPDGTVVVAMQTPAATPAQPLTGRDGVVVATRPPGALSFGPPQRVAGGDGTPAGLDDVAVAPDGTRAVAVGLPFVDGVPQLAVAVAPPGGAFGAPRAVPMPAASDGSVDPNDDVRDVHVALSSDDRTVVIFGRGTNDPATTGTFVVVGRPDGTWGAPQQLSGYDSFSADALTAVGSGEALALFQTEDAAGDLSSRVEVACHLGPGAVSFDVCQPLDADGMISSGAVTLAGDARGDAAAVVSETTTDMPLFASQTRTFTRGPGEGFGAPAQIFPAPAFAASVGVSARGDVVVDAVATPSVVFGQPMPEWPIITASERPPGGAFSAPDAGGGFVGPGGASSTLAVDATGGAVIAAPYDYVPDRPNAATVHELWGWYRPPSGPVQAVPARLGVSGTTPSHQQVVADAYGNGLVTWIATRHGASVLLERTYAAHAPVVSATLPTGSALNVTLSEPATVTLDVSAAPAPSPDAVRARAAQAPRRLAHLRLRLPAGHSTVPLPAAARAAHGRVIAHLSAGNGGPHASHAVAVVLRRR